MEIFHRYGDASAGTPLARVLYPLSFDRLFTKKTDKKTRGTKILTRETGLSSDVLQGRKEMGDFEPYKGRAKYSAPERPALVEKQTQKPFDSAQFN
jgi:hypothetical protein